MQNKNLSLFHQVIKLALSRGNIIVDEGHMLVVYSKEGAQLFTINPDQLEQLITNLGLTTVSFGDYKAYILEK